MIRSFNVLSLLILFFSGYGQNKWDASLIADSLKKDANAVIRFYSTEFTRLSVGSYLMKIHQVVTILNESGIPASQLLIYYDRNSKVTSIEENIYDKTGKLIQEIKKKDFNDYAYNADYTLFSDSRVKHYLPANNSYPYTVEYAYTVEYNSVIGFDTWMPQWFNISVEKAQLSFITPADIGLRYKELNYPFKMVTNVVDKGKKYQWFAENLPSISREFSGPDYLDLFPAVLLAPNEISFEGHSGDFKSWNSYGKWVYDLIKERCELPPSVLEEVRQLTDPIPDRRDKVKALYRYMQQKTRYVNIALGIGGLQPIPASAVHEKGYGDCKALSNYMRALLKSIDIDAWYTTIGNGPSQKIKFPDFPSKNQTNHIILCVPLDQDTVWLECTSQTMPFGYIGSGNSDRYGILITPEGGVLARTPVYAAETNSRISTIRTTLMENGSAAFEVNSQFQDYLYEDVSGLITSSKDEQKKELLRSLSANGMEINSFSLTDISDRHAKAFLNIKGNIKSYFVKAGNRLFVQPNFLYENTFSQRIRKDRKQNLCEHLGYCYRDTIHLSLPENFKVEFLPDNTELSSIYGTYQMTYLKENDNQVTLIRSVKINKGNYDTSSFKEINAFLMNIAKREKEKIVLVTKV
jgi:hypothetical protein